MNSKANHRYRIQAVAHRTGVPATTLRAWERRYGIPSPERTQTAYRTYSERDIQLVERLHSLCESGLSPAEAAKLLRDEQAVLIPEALTATSNLPSDEQQVGQNVYQAAVNRMLLAIRAMDVVRLDDELVRVRELGSAAQIVERVLRPVLTTVGALWHAGELSIAHEHLATEMITGTLRDLLRLSQPSGEHRLALLACFADELHASSLYSVAFQWIGWGCRVVTMGALTPPSAVGTAVRTLKPAVVGLSVTIAPTGARARELVENYALACAAVPWVVGGQGAIDIAPLVTQFGGNVVSEMDADGRALLARLLDRTSTR